MIYRHSTPATLLALAILAGCGGGGGDDTAVSASPSPAPGATAPEPAPTPPPTAETPAPPAQTPSPPAQTPSPPAQTPQPPAPQPPAPTADTVPATAVAAALYAGVSADPARAGNPYSNARLLSNETGDVAIELVSTEPYEMNAYRLGDGFPPTGSSLGRYDVTRIRAVVANNAITAVEANGEQYDGPALSLNGGDLALNTAIATWTRGAFSVKLVLTGIAERPDLMRVCWDVHLPPPAPVTGPAGYVAPPHLARTAPFERLLCAVSSRYNWSGDVGGYVIDSGTIMQGYW